MLGVHTQFNVPAEQQQPLTILLQQGPPATRSLLDPAMLAELQQVDPDALPLLFRLIDRQQQHDHAMDMRTLDVENSYRIHGLYVAIGALLILVVPSAIAFWSGHPTSGLVLGLMAGAASVAGVFVRGRNLTRMAAAGEPADPSKRLPPTTPGQPIPTHPPPRPQN